MKTKIYLILFIGSFLVISCNSHKSVVNTAMSAVRSDQEFFQLYQTYGYEKEPNLVINEKTTKNEASFEVTFPVKPSQDTSTWWSDKFIIKVFLDKNKKVLFLQDGISGIIRKGSRLDFDTQQ